MKLTFPLDLMKWIRVSFCFYVDLFFSVWLDLSWVPLWVLAFGGRVLGVASIILGFCCDGMLLLAYNSWMLKRVISFSWFNGVLGEEIFMPIV